MKENFILIENLNKSFEDKEVIKNFNCNIQKGDFVAISGASGCGKTTLLNMIGGLEPITCGSIVVDGTNLAKQKNLEEYYRDTVGFVFQNFALVEHKTVEQNLCMILNKGKSDTPMLDALKLVGMENTEKQKVYQLSGGQQQRIALARLKMKKCSLILADEPTGSLDKDNASKVMEILKSLNDEGKTVIIVTHDLKITKSSYITKNIIL